MKKTLDPAPEQETKMPVPSANEQPKDGKAEGRQWFDVLPSQTVSVCAGNRVLFMGTGITGIMVHQQAK